MSSGGSKEATVVPRLSTISPITGRAYLAAAQRYCLTHFSNIVPIFCLGVIPTVCLESVLPYERRNLIGRKAGSYSDSTGQRMMADQSAAEYRKEIIATTLTEQKLNPDADGLNKAIRLLFPPSSFKSREKSRTDILDQSQSLIQNLMLLWPEESIALEMSLDVNLQQATQAIDLIAWTNAFTAFCLNNSGNLEMNIRAAEKALDETKMKGLDVNSYVKSFKVAAQNVKTCRSTMPEDRIVSTFFRNLNQGEDAYYRYDCRYLDPSDNLHQLVSQPLQKSIEHVEKYYKEVILPRNSAKKSINNGREVINITTAAQFRSLLQSNNNNKSNFNVPAHVIAAMLKNNNNKGINKDTDNKNKNNNNNTNNNNANNSNNSNNNPNNNNPSVGGKRKADEDVKAEPSTEESKTDGGHKPKFKKQCFHFNKGGTCKYGANCFWQHVTSSK